AGAYAFSDANGLFTFPNSVFPGFNAFLIPYAESNYANYYFDPPTKSIKTAMGNDFIGRPTTASISGKVSVGGVGKSGVLVTTDLQNRAATTDTNGDYTITGVAEGLTLTVQVDTRIYPFSPSTQTLTVNGQKTNVNFDAPANQFLIYGQVTGADFRV